MHKTLLSMIGLLAGASLFNAQAINIAEGKAVTLNGTFFTDGGTWGAGVPGTAASLTDGLFLPTGTQWNLGTVWWNSFTQPGNNIVVDLGGDYLISGLTAQADDNDEYRIEFWDGANWQTAWDIRSVNTYGMETRTVPNPHEPASLNLTTSKLRFTATGGDGYVSVSEIQAEGRALQQVPELTSTFGLLALGMGGLGLLGRKRR